MTGLEMLGYFSLGFIPTLAFVHLAWKLIRRKTERLTERNIIQK